MKLGGLKFESYFNSILPPKLFYMRNNFKKFQRISLVLIPLLNILNEKTEAQDQRDIPSMWVSKANSIERRLWFRFGTLVPGNKSKERIITGLSGNPSRKTLSSKFPVSSFDDLIRSMESDFPSGFNGLNVYVTAFRATCRGPLDPATTPNKELVLVYAPARVTDSNYADLGIYYIINPNDNRCHRVTTEIKNCWHSYYISSVVRGSSGLLTTLDSREDENQAPDGTKSDTRLISYNYDHFKDFIVNERNYQDNNPETNPQRIRISEIEIVWASYPETGIGTNRYGYREDKFKNRLIIIFEFIRNGKIFYIDDATDFPGRLESMNRKKMRYGFDFGADNGQLCPPNCPTDRQ